MALKVYNDADWIGSNIRYEGDRKNVEAFWRQYHVPQKGGDFITADVQVLQVVPEYPALSLITRIHEKGTWSHYTLPPDFFAQRLFGRFLTPSFSSDEKIEADMTKITLYLKQTGNEALAKEGSALMNLLHHVLTTNADVTFVNDKMMQFIAV